MKTIVIREDHSLQIRAEIMNLLNNPAWFIGHQDINSVSFGRISGTANGARRIQLSVRYRF